MEGVTSGQSNKRHLESYSPRNRPPTALIALLSGRGARRRRRAATSAGRCSARLPDAEARAQPVGGHLLTAAPLRNGALPATASVTARDSCLIRRPVHRPTPCYGLVPRIARAVRQTTPRAGDCRWQHLRFFPGLSGRGPLSPRFARRGAGGPLDSPALPSQDGSACPTRTPERVPSP